MLDRPSKPDANTETHNLSGKKVTCFIVSMPSKDGDDDDDDDNVPSGDKTPQALLFILRRLTIARQSIEGSNLNILKNYTLFIGELLWRPPLANIIHSQP